MPETGVYRIYNLVSRKSYVGSAATSLRRRWKDHRCALRNGTHHSRHLQAAWKKYGEAAFRFEVLERCPPHSCLAREQAWMNGLMSADRCYGYNVSPVAGSCRGVVHGEPMREKTSRRWDDQAFRDKMAASHATDDYRLKASARASKNWSDANYRKKQLKVRRSKTYRAKHSASMKVHWESGGGRERVARTHSTAEVKAKCSAASAASWADPVRRAKRIASLKRAAAKLRADPKRAAAKSARISVACRGTPKRKKVRDA